MGVILSEHVANNSCVLKFRYDSKDSGAGTGHLVTNSTVAVEDRLDIVQFQILLSDHGIKDIVQVLADLTEIA